MNLTELKTKPIPELIASGRPVPGLDMTFLKSGKVKIVNVWASWCAPCKIEHPLLMELAGRDDVEIAGINYKDRPENARRFLGTLGNPYVAVGVDANGRTSVDWGVYGVPETFIVDGAGNIVHKHVGPLTAPVVAETILPIVKKANEMADQTTPSQN